MNALQQKRDRILKTIYVLGFLASFSYWNQKGVLPYLTRKLGVTPAVYGYLESSFAFYQMITSPLYGLLADRYGVRFWYMVSEAASGITFGGLAFVNNIPTLFLSRVPALLIHSLQCKYMIITDITNGTERAGILGKLGVTHGLGMISGSFIGGLVTEAFNEKTVAILAACGNFTSVLIIFFFIPKNTKSIKAEVENEFRQVKGTCRVEDNSITQNASRSDFPKDESSRGASILKQDENEIPKVCKNGLGKDKNMQSKSTSENLKSSKENLKEYEKDPVVENSGSIIPADMKSCTIDTNYLENDSRSKNPICMAKDLANDKTFDENIKLETRYEDVSLCNDKDLAQENSGSAFEPNLNELSNPNTVNNSNDNPTAKAEENDEKTRQVDEDTKINFSLTVLWTTLCIPNMKLLLILKVATTFPFAVLYSMFSVAVMDFYGLGPKINGYLLSYIGGLGILIQGLLVGFLSKRFKDSFSLTLALFLSLIGYLYLSVARNVYMLVVFIAPLLVGSIVSHLLLMVIITKLAPSKDTGSALGLVFALHSIVRALAPTLGGLMFSTIGWPFIGVLGYSIHFIVIGFFILFVNDSHINY